MLALGWVLFELNQTFSAIFAWFLPAVLAKVIVLGIGALGSLMEGMLYFVTFGLGFGWPLVALPFLAAPVQRYITRWLARHHAIVGRLSGALLIVVAVFGFWADVLPSL